MTVEHPRSLRLELVGAARRLHLGALADADRDDPVYTARFVGPPPRVRRLDDRLRLDFRTWLWPLLGTRATDLALHPRVRWRLAVRGGLDRSDLDLTRLHVDDLRVHGGLDRVTLRLPAPASDLAVDLRGGSRGLRLVVPPGVALRLRLDGGARRLQIDTLRVDALGGRFVWETPGYAAAPRRVDVRVRGGACDLAVDWQSDPLSLFDPHAPTHLAAWPRLFFGGPR